MSSKEQKEEVHGHESNDAEKNDDDMPQKEEMRFSSEEEAVSSLDRHTRALIDGLGM